VEAHRFTLRAVAADDQPFLRALHHALRRSEFAAAPLPPTVLEQLLDTQFEAQRRHYAHQYPDAQQHLIILDGARVGHLWTQWSTTELRVIDVSLLDAFRRRGIGTSLLQWLQSAAGERGLPIRLSVRRGNPAVRLYARLDFAERASNQTYQQLEWRPKPDAAA
jgi:ribosomal protein S18 acetylase RimI-like enzyme